MCLFSQNIIPLVSDQPVTCYKVLEEVYCSADSINNDKLILTPFMGQCVTRDEFDGKAPMKPDFKKQEDHQVLTRHPKSIIPYIMIESGVIHAYLDKGTALLAMKDYFSKLSTFGTVRHQGIMYCLVRYILCECEIPAGTKYYKGGDEPLQIENEESCGAEQIVIKRVIAEIKDGKITIL